MRVRKVEVLAVPVLESHIEAMRLIAEQRMISIDRLASEMIAKETQRQSKLLGGGAGTVGAETPVKPQVKPSKKKPHSDAPEDLLVRSIGKQIRLRRLLMGMSQAELSKRAGFSRAFIVDVESGNRSIGLDNLYQLASILEIEGSHLVHLAEQMNIDPTVRNEVIDCGTGDPQE
ncbi:MAG TPA: helix-turn-helix transcriptional regulator [Candidatus Melainabacteria bacterium]|nr:helix-turn-helix transcriptional regulator [Candidatus Melainabacteria bacterium]